MNYYSRNINYDVLFYIEIIRIRITVAILLLTMFVRHTGTRARNVLIRLTTTRRRFAKHVFRRRVACRVSITRAHILPMHYYYYLPIESLSLSFATVKKTTGHKMENAQIRRVIVFCLLCYI